MYVFDFLFSTDGLWDAIGSCPGIRSILIEIDDLPTLGDNKTPAKMIFADSHNAFPVDRRVSGFDWIPIAFLRVDFDPVPFQCSIGKGWSEE